MNQKASNRPFRSKSLRPSTWFHRVLRTMPKENAIIEVNNLLAQGMEQITDIAVQGIREKYKFKSQPFVVRISQFYRDYLKHCLEDNLIDDEEAHNLQHLKHVLGLYEISVSEIHKEVGEPVLRRVMEQVMGDGKIGKDGWKQLKKLHSALRLSEKKTNQIRAEVGSQLLQRLSDEALADGMLSPEDEQRILETAKNIGGLVDFDKETKEAYRVAKLMWTARKSPVLPVVETRINLQRKEECYFIVSSVDWYETRKVSQRIRYAGPTARIRLAKGLYWRMGDIGVKRISREELRKIDSGKLYLTNKRLIFRGTEKNRTILFSRILDVTEYREGVEIEKDAGKNPYLELGNDTEVFAQFLKRVLKDVRS